MNKPSIFNDVIGPVMRGPSSSHSAAALRIGQIARDLMGGNFNNVLVEYDPKGALATTHKSQGSDMGLFGGLLGWDTADERLPKSAEALVEAGIHIETHIVDVSYDHPSAYKLTLSNSEESRGLIAISTGGGMIEVVEIDGVSVAMDGDVYETLIQSEENLNESYEFLIGELGKEQVVLHESMIETKTLKPLSSEIQSKIKGRITQIAPVLPVLANKAPLPFLSCEELLAYNEERNLSIWELAVCYETARSGLSADEVFEKMDAIVSIIRKSIGQGLEGTEYKDRILGPQSVGYKACMDGGTLLGGDLMNRIIMYISAMMEVKSSMGVIVAAPTAGACACLPGACIGAADSMGLSQDEMTKSMLAAGLIGIFIAESSTFSAEVGGCQAECGSAAGMAAAALVSMAGGTVHQAVSAASMAMQNSIGMVCDPVANRVEAPCLGKNTTAAMNALACSNMSLAGFDAVIPLDEVIEITYRVGRSMPCELRCTGLGGLSITKTSQALAARLSEAE